MKSPVLLLVIFLFAASVAKSQDVPPSLSGYPLTVIVKVSDVSSVITLSSEKQTALANYFQRELNSLSAAMQSDPTGKQAAEAKKTLIIEFQSILTAAELQQYSIHKPGSEYALPANNYSGSSPQNTPSH